ncbi:MAG: NAD-dependent epimerase/dehydratase family protein [Kineosporiaceae bacterium]
MVLVTGVSRAVGAGVAVALAASPGVDRVVGLASTLERSEPSRAGGLRELPGVDLVTADPRGGALAAAVERVRPDVVVHLGLVATPARVGGRSVMKEINVIGTMHLLAACQRSTTVRRVVLGSTSAVYGASPRDPALVAEDTEPAAAPRSGWGRDCVEVESYARGLARRRPGVAVLALRLADVVGPSESTPLADYLALPAVPTVLGFDPRLQFLHEDDAVAACVAAVDSDLAGAVNVAGDGVLLLSQAAHLAGRVTVPVLPPLAGAVARGLGRTRVGEVTADQQAFLRYGRCLDTTRMRRDLGFEPRLTTREAFLEQVRARGLHGPLTPQAMAGVRRGVAGALGVGR